MSDSASIPSASNERSNVLRRQYRELSGEEKLAVLAVKGAGEAFLEVLDKHCLANRETALARTRLEEAVMWAVKSISA